MFLMTGGATCGQIPPAKFSTKSSRAVQESYPLVIVLFLFSFFHVKQWLGYVIHTALRLPTTSTAYVYMNINKLNTEAPQNHIGPLRRIA